MKLLSEALELKDFLKSFEIDMPFLPTQILTGFSATEGWQHYSELRQLDQALSDKQVKEKLLLYQALPQMELVYQALSKGEWDRPSFYVFLKYYKAGREIHPESLKELDFKNLLNTQGIDFVESPYQEKMKALELGFYQETQKLEKEVFAKTGISMKYLLGKTIDGELPKAVQQTSVIKCYPRQNGWLLELGMTEEMSYIKMQMDRVAAQMDEEAALLLAEFGKIVEQNQKEIIDNINQLKKEAYQLALVFTKRLHGYVWPRPGESLFVKKLFWPYLKDLRGREYEALDVEWSPGASALLGPNMSGKTTVLSTLQFALLCVQMGLPVPAQEITLSFPETVKYHKKTSGSWEKNLSSFTAELEFFKTEFSKKSYVLVDELFQSTNPISGLYMAQIFLSHFAEEDIYLMGSTHYLDVLSLQKVQFLKMTEAYSVEKIDPKNISFDISMEILKPFEVALAASLPPKLHQRLKEWRDSYGENPYQ